MTAAMDFGGWVQTRDRRNDRVSTGAAVSLRHQPQKATQKGIGMPVFACFAAVHALKPANQRAVWPQSSWGLAFVLCAFAPATAAADTRACLSLDQRYEQIKTAASSVERNIMLFSAAAQDCLPLAKRLLEAGASLESRDKLGNMVLGVAAREGNLALVTLFLDQKAALDARNLEGSTALFQASEAEHLAVAKALLEKGADPNIAGRSAIAPLSAATYTGNSELVAVLLAKGAEPRAVDATGKTAIIYAAGRAYTSVVQRLLDTGIDVNARYGNDLTALMWAAGHSEEAGAADVLETLKLLIGKGAKLDDADDRGRTALMTAAELGHKIAVEVLIKAGANGGLRDKDGKTATDLAPDDATRTLLAAK